MSRQKILATIRQNKPAFQPRPELKTSDAEHNKSRPDLVALFKGMTEVAGGRVIELNGLKEVKTAIQKHFSDSKAIYCSVPDLDISTMNSEALHDLDQLAGLDLAICPGGVAVAENGAVWVNNEDVDVRAVWFITRHLALIVQKKNIVPNMLDAYHRLDVNRPGFGCFISGPSKTADIEQSLVIGAHGAISLTIFLLE